MDFDNILNRQKETPNERPMETPEPIQTFGEETEGAGFGGDFGRDGGEFGGGGGGERFEPVDRDALVKKSEMIVGIIDFAGSRIGARFSGGSADEYKASRTEKKDLVKTVSMYLETLPPSSIMSAKAALIIALVMYLGGVMIQAFDEKKSKAKEKSTRKKKRESGEIVDISESSNLRYYTYEKGRGKFRLNQNGNYWFDENGEYVGNSSNQEPHDDVLNLIDKGLTGWEIKRQISNSSQPPINPN